jgi:hypothetical protein
MDVDDGHGGLRVLGGRRPMLAQMTDDPLGESAATAAAEHIEYDAEQARTWLLAVSGGDGADEDELPGELRRLRAEAMADGGRGASWATVLADLRVRSAEIVAELSNG